MWTSFSWFYDQLVPTIFVNQRYQIEQDKDHLEVYRLHYWALSSISRRDYHEEAGIFWSVWKDTVNQP